MKTMFNHAEVESLFHELVSTVGYEAQKALYNEIIATVQNQSGWVQGNEENGIQGGEYKSQDQDGDLVTCSIIGHKVSYQRTSRQGDNDGIDDGVMKFNLADAGDRIIVS